MCLVTLVLTTHEYFFENKGVLKRSTISEKGMCSEYATIQSQDW